MGEILAFSPSLLLLPGFYGHPHSGFKFFPFRKKWRLPRSVLSPPVFDEIETVRLLLLIKDDCKVLQRGVGNTFFWLEREIVWILLTGFFFLPPSPSSRLVREEEKKKGKLDFASLLFNFFPLKVSRRQQTYSLAYIFFFAVIPRKKRLLKYFFRFSREATFRKENVRDCH